MQDRLLNAYLSGSIEESVFHDKTSELKRDVESIEQSRAALNESPDDHSDAALALFDWSEDAAEIWARSKMPLRREILN